MEDKELHKQKIISDLELESDQPLQLDLSLPAFRSVFADYEEDGGNAPALAVLEALKHTKRQVARLKVSLYSWFEKGVLAILRAMLTNPRFCCSILGQIELEEQDSLSGIVLTKILESADLFPNLKKLRLFAWNCSEERSRIIAESFSSMPKLKCLDLEFNKSLADFITEQPYGEILHALRLLNLSRLSLVLKCCDEKQGSTLAESIKHMSKLESLILRVNFTSASLKKLSDSFKSLRRLTVLHLRCGNSLQKEGLVHFFVEFTFSSPQGCSPKSFRGSDFGSRIEGAATTGQLLL